MRRHMEDDVAVQVSLLPSIDVKEEIAEIMHLVPEPQRERMTECTADQFVDVPVPQFHKDREEMGQEQRASAS